MLADYHLHSEFSDDSTTPMEDQVQTAMSRGLSEMCFTDHVDYGIKKDWDEGGILWRGGGEVGGYAPDREPLANVNYPEYFSKILRMREAFGNRISIKAGLELGVQTHTIPRYQALVERYADQLDFCLLSIHQVGDLEFWTGDFQRVRTQEEYTLRYYDEMLAVIRAFRGYDVLAHLDLIVRYDPAGPIAFQKVRDVVAEVLRTAIADGKGIEINTSSWHYGLADTQPSRQILSLYRDLGGRIITTGSDAHKPEYLGDHFDEAREILRGLGYTEVYTFDHHEPIAHEL